MVSLCSSSAPATSSISSLTCRCLSAISQIHLWSPSVPQGVLTCVLHVQETILILVLVVDVRHSCRGLRRCVVHDQGDRLDRRFACSDSLAQVFVYDVHELCAEHHVGHEELFVF